MAKVATREAYGKALAELIQKDDKIFVLDADLTKSTKTSDAQAVKPERHFNIGIAEGNMMGIAAGIASCGNTVFASSFAMFAAGRAFEQIRNSICYPKLNVKICGTHAGITVGEDGASHQSVEDIALMRAIPNMKVFQPCDAVETKQIIEAVSKIDGPVFVRLGRSGVETIYDENYTFEIGKGHVVSPGKDIAIIATGVLVQESLQAKELLKEAGLDVTVVNMASIKPIDEALIIELAKTHKGIVTAEEHNVYGGLGSAVAEVVVQNHPVPMSIIGLEDTFGESGKPAELLDKYGLSAKRVAEKVKAFAQKLD